MRFRREDIERMWVQAVRAIGVDKYPRHFWEEEYEKFVYSMTSGKKCTVFMPTEDEFTRQHGVIRGNPPKKGPARGRKQNFSQQQYPSPALPQEQHTQPKQQAKQPKQPKHTQANQHYTQYQHQQQHHQQPAKPHWQQQAHPQQQQHQQQQHIQQHLQQKNLQHLQQQPLNENNQYQKLHQQPLQQQQKQLQSWTPPSVPQTQDTKFNNPKPELPITTPSRDLAHSFVKAKTQSDKFNKPKPEQPIATPLRDEAHTYVKPQPQNSSTTSSTTQMEPDTSVSGEQILFSPVKHDIGDTSEFFDSLPPISMAIGKTVTKATVPPTVGAHSSKIHRSKSKKKRRH